MKTHSIIFLFGMVLFLLSSCHSISNEMAKAIRDNDLIAIQTIVQGDNNSWKNDTYTHGAYSMNVIEYACKVGTPQCVRMILEKFSESENNHTLSLSSALSKAVLRDSVEIANELLHANANIGSKSKVLLFRRLNLASFLMQHSGCEVP